MQIAVEYLNILVIYEILGYYSCNNFANLGVKMQLDELDHTEEIRRFINVICNSNRIHALIVDGLPGWGKSTAVQEALNSIQQECVHVGAYSTPLNLYTFLASHPDKIVLLDDCAGLFQDRIGMALLKAATWPSQNKKRIVKYGSFSGYVEIPYFEFTGKLIIVCNSFPTTPDGNAIKSRSYMCRLRLGVNEAKQLLIKGAEEKKYFPDTKLAREVSEFLVENLSESTLPEICFRAFEKCYDYAQIYPQSWQKSFKKNMLEDNKAIDPAQLVKDLAKKNMKVKEQVRIFEEKTGLKQRSFYNYRKEFDLKWKISQN